MAIIILCFWSPSPKHRHDLHRHRLDTLISIIASWSSRQLLLLQLLLTHSDKVKQLHGACISYNKETTIRLLPVADKLQNMIISYNNVYHIMSWPYHITAYPAKTSYTSSTLLLQVWRGCYGFLARTVLTYGKTTTTVNYQVCCFNLLQGPAVVKFDSTKVRETDTRQPPLCKTSCMSVGGTGLMYVDM